MEIGISTDQLIDIGLNVIGFMASGLLCGTVYSLFSKRGRGTVQGVAAATAEKRVVAEQSVERRAENGRHYDFVTFKSSGTTPKALPSEAAVEERYRSRDRREILKQARELLAQKKGVSEVGATLPITEAELSFLKQNLNFQGSARS